MAALSRALPVYEEKTEKYDEVDDLSFIEGEAKYSYTHQGYGYQSPQSSSYKPRCKTVYETSYRTLYEEKCSTSYKTECDTSYETFCHTKYQTSYEEKVENYTVTHILLVI